MNTSKVSARIKTKAGKRGRKEEERTFSLWIKPKMEPGGRELQKFHLAKRCSELSSTFHSAFTMLGQRELEYCLLRAICALITMDVENRRAQLICELLPLCENGFSRSLPLLPSTFSLLPRNDDFIALQIQQHSPRNSYLHGVQVPWW